jgi:hypothetical protein
VILNLISTLILAQAGIPAYSIPPSQERVIFFTDRGRTYIVGVESNTVKYLDDSAPSPPDVNPVNPLTGQAKAFFELVVRQIPTKQSQQAGARVMIDSIDATVAQIGALGLSLEQAVNTLASYTQAGQMGTIWAGFRLGDWLDGQKITTIEQFTAVLSEIRKACEVLAK